MIKARFKTKSVDYRPINWPIKHPYWCTGMGDDYHTIVAYADDINELKSNWPEAYEIETKEVENYVFTSRFYKPDWFSDKKAEKK